MKIYFSILIIIILFVKLFKNTERFETKHNFNDIINHIYVINLEQSKKRLNKLNHMANKSGIAIERFPAILGRKINFNYLNSKGYLQNKKLIKFNGNLGCYMSHCLLLEKIYKENKYENVLILEDDCLIDSNFKKQMEDISDYIPNDFDYIMLGSGIRKGESYNDKFLQPEEGNVSGQNAGLFGYIVKVRNIPNILNLIKPIRDNIFIDTVLRSNFTKLNVFIVKENIINHNYDFKSDRGSL
jgi:GR25 family glycosyltransferase involved in LPS biosynthesis